MSAFAESKKILGGLLIGIEPVNFFYRSSVKNHEEVSDQPMACDYSLYYVAEPPAKPLAKGLLHSAKQIPKPSCLGACPLGATNLGVQTLLALELRRDYSRVRIRGKSENFL